MKLRVVGVSTPWPHQRREASQTGGTAPPDVPLTQPAQRERPLRRFFMTALMLRPPPPEGSREPSEEPDERGSVPSLNMMVGRRNKLVIPNQPLSYVQWQWDWVYDPY